MKLAFIDLCGFRGYRKQIRVEFADRFTIIDGRNGVGKSTLFDAVEFALTGTLSKYDDAKADGESVSDYIWWAGDGPSPAERYVNVGFRDEDNKEIVIRRSQFEDPDEEDLAELAARMAIPLLAPRQPFQQLCSSGIIRDEHIASLSLDLREAERYSLLRQALGANDADRWIARGAEIVARARARSIAAQSDVTSANAEVAIAARTIDDVRAKLVADSVLAEAVARLRGLTDSNLPVDRLVGPVREKIAELAEKQILIQDMVVQWSSVEEERIHLVVLDVQLVDQQADYERALAEARAQPAAAGEGAASELAAEARRLIDLIMLGRQLGLQDGKCPLCATAQSHAAFEHGLVAAEAIAQRMDEQAVREAEQEGARKAIAAKLADTQSVVASTINAISQVEASVNSFDTKLKSLGLTTEATPKDLLARMAEFKNTLEAARKDLGILETLRLNSDLERAQRSEVAAKERLSKAQERFGRARKAETGARALHDAARRAASETVDQRLDRVLPLMSELYQRLRPHPFWRDIEYSIRGDVRRFLKLQVGDDLNPQFLFSSGQRRATGLAFLLSVNMSLTWSRWRSILLDDPVQHVDDFRTVHLAELLAQLVAQGRQIICSVEDPALADLLCRRLPVDKVGDATRITLGQADDGTLAQLKIRELSPFMQRSLFGNEQSVAG